MDSLEQQDIDRIIEMAWEDRTSFEDIYNQFNLKEKERSNGNRFQQSSLKTRHLAKRNQRDFRTIRQELEWIRCHPGTRNSCTSH